MNKIYSITLDGNLIGTTQFESADVPMGVLHGKILFENIDDPYSFIKSYCNKRSIGISHEEPKFKFIDTEIIPGLKVYNENGNPLEGWGGTLTVFENQNEFEIQFAGVNSDTMKTQFPHHYRAYYKD